MNVVILCGRLTRDPETRYSSGENSVCIARFGLAVDRPRAKEGEQQADFLNCVCFGKRGEALEKYVQKGTKILVRGRLQSGSYTAKDGHKVYTTDVIVDEWEFAQSKGAAAAEKAQENEDFMDIPEGAEAEGLPWN